MCTKKQGCRIILLLLTKRSGVMLFGRGTSDLKKYLRKGVTEAQLSALF